MDTVINAKLPGDVGRVFNAHAARKHVQASPSPEDVWTHLCNVNMSRPRSRDKDRTKLYEGLLQEWNNLSIDTSPKWTQGLEQRLGSVSDVDDFFDWRRSRIRLARPDFDCLAPHDFARFLRVANWRQDHLATQIVTGRLWYGSTGDKADYILGWFKSNGEYCVHGLRLNAHIFDLKETELDLCGELGISTLLPHMFVGIRYRTDHLQDPPVESVTTCAVVLGELISQPDIKSTASPVIVSSNQPEPTGHLLACDLSNSRLYVLLNPNTSATIRAIIQVAELVDEAGESFLKHGFWSPDIPDAKKQQGIPVVEWKVLSLTQPEFAEVGLHAMNGAYIAMFPHDKSL